MLNFLCSIFAVGSFLFFLMAIVSIAKKEGQFFKRFFFSVLLLICTIIVGSQIALGKSLPIEENQGFFFVVLSVLFIAAIITFINVRRLLKQYKIGAHISFPCTHLYGIPHVPEISFISLYMTNEKLVIEWKNINFELPFYKITGAAALTKTVLSNKYHGVYRKGVTRGTTIEPWEIVDDGVFAIAEHQIKGKYLTINYRTEGKIKLIIFDMQKVSNAKSAAKALTKHLKKNVSIPKGGTIEL